jgi:anti-sigma regulatory factor (Ser/Thr protein kinase)
MTELSSEESSYTLTLLAQFENLERVRAFVGRHAEAYGLSPAEVYSVQLAVDEAFSNVVEHAYGGECHEKIECTCQITDQGLVITLRDCGRPFQPEEIPNPDLEAELQAREIGGLGLYFIRQLMDEVEFTFISETEPQRTCNVLRMVKRKENTA